MSVHVKEENQELVLTLDNGDREKFTQALNKWQFKDEESLLRFVVSLLLESHDSKSMGIYTKESPTTLISYKPATHLLKEMEDSE